MKEFMKGLAITILFGVIIIYTQGYYWGIALPLNINELKLQVDSYWLFSLVQWLRLILIIIILIFLYKKAKIGRLTLLIVSLVLFIITLSLFSNFDNTINAYRYTSHGVELTHVVRLYLATPSFD